MRKLWFLLLFLALGPGCRFRPPDPPPLTLYLPVILRPALTFDPPAIWTHTQPPAAHEVALFRKSWTATTGWHSATLEIFADTRYELWLDGRRLGRGPVRFLPRLREYDRYPIGEVTTGTHTLAVIVQWAPNLRRSASITPLLMVRIAGRDPAGRSRALESGPDWKALSTTAWAADAAPVHTDGLIGPTELLDLSRLPADWMMPGFVDTSWPAAAIRPPLQPAPLYRPRSLAMLETVTMPLRLLEEGTLSPGRTLIQLPAEITQLTITLQHRGWITLETLGRFQISTPLTDSAPLSVTLDNTLPGEWQRIPDRPGVWQIRTFLETGPHTLSTLESNPFTIAGDGLTLTAPLAQGPHAGRRLLLAEPISHPTTFPVTPQLTLDLEATDLPTYWVLDLGRTVHGRIVAEVEGPAGTLIDIGWDERLWQNRRPLPYPGYLHNNAWNQVDSWRLDGRRRTITTIDSRAGRYLLIATFGKGQIRLTDLHVEEERYPLEERGSFSSSDARLNEIWNVGRSTLYPNMTDAYSDTPWRERGQWLGDAFVEHEINQVTFGETDLLRHGLWQFGHNLEPDGRLRALAPHGEGAALLDFEMLWVQLLNDYRRRTGDSDLAAELYPALQTLMADLERRENPATDLLDLPAGHWSQTSLIDWAAWYDRYGQSTALNSIYARTLQDAAELATELGHPADAAHWNQQARRLPEQINALLYDPRTGLYAASLIDGERFTPTVHAQAWPLAYGLVSPTEASRVTDNLIAMLSTDPTRPNVELYGHYWVLQALGDQGRITDALRLIDTNYGYMLDRGAATWWETLSAESRYPNSLSHGWSGAPTWFLSSYLLGAQELPSGTWQIRPAFTGVTWAAGRIPGRAGDLEIRWERISPLEARLEITSTVPFTAEVILPPIGAGGVITMDGNAVWQNETPSRPAIRRRPNGMVITLTGVTQTEIIWQP